MYIKEKLDALGYDDITPIQKGVFKAFKHKKNLVGLAPTGTGKTHAYLLPLLEAIHDIKDQLSAVILVPTNELVIQVHQMLEKTDASIIAKAYYGGGDKQSELKWLSKRQPQVIITTPKRFYEYLYDANAIKSQTVKYLILDEADMMFDYDFLSIIDPILTRLPNASYKLFSASITKDMQPFISQYFGQYELIDVTSETILKISYVLVNIKYRDRTESLLELLKTFQPYLAFIFVSKKEDQLPIFEALSLKGYQVVNLNADLSVKQRKKVIDDIKALKYQYVVASDLAARGMDFQISHVIHYDLPHHLEFFMHRSGRTGRMHDNGTVYTFMSVTDHRKVDKLKKQGIPFVAYELRQGALVKKERKQSHMSEAEANAIKQIKKPTQVKPNYKKKYKALVTKAKKKARRKAND
ncbi:MAG: DEAD/DEAH box helicase [Acholeplasmataceae bacterium]